MKKLADLLMGYALNNYATETRTNSQCWVWLRDAINEATGRKLGNNVFDNQRMLIILAQMADRMADDE